MAAVCVLRSPQFRPLRCAPARAGPALALRPSTSYDSRILLELSVSSGRVSHDLASASGRGKRPVLRHGIPAWNAASPLRKPGKRQRRRAPCSAGFRAHEEAATVKEIAGLSESLLSLKGMVGREYRAIGPDMRERVDRLYDRVILLQQSADRSIAGGARIPTLLTANLIALQREHGSLENIVRLAMEAGPALASIEATVGTPNKLSDAASNLLLEEAKPKASVFQSLIRESAVDPPKAAPKYVMSAPASQGSSPLAAFRAEIERRVIEQLSGKKKVDLAVKSSIAVSTVTELPLLSTQTRIEALDEVARTKQPSGSTLETQEMTKGQNVGLGAAEVEGGVTFVEKKLKQLESDLAKSIPLQIFEQTVGKINTSLSEARGQIAQLTAEAAEKEVILAAVKKDMLAEKEHLIQRVRELTGDLEKKFSVEDMEAAVNFGLEDAERELEEEQELTFRLSIELEKKEKLLLEQQEKYRLLKEEMEKKLQEEQDRTLSLNLELEKKEKLMVEQEEQWKVQKMSLETELISVKTKMKEVRKKRTRERAELAEKKQKVKFLEQELARVLENMEEADKIRLKKKEAMYATVRVLISQMVQSSRARAHSEAHATTLVQEMAKLQEEKQALEISTKAAEDKAGLAEAEVEGMKSKVGKEVANLQGELLSSERAAALEKFFAIMAQLIKEESENIEESSLLSMESDYEELDEIVRQDLSSVSTLGDDGDEDAEMVTNRIKQNGDKRGFAQGPQTTTSSSINST